MATTGRYLSGGVAGLAAFVMTLAAAGLSDDVKPAATAPGSRPAESRAAGVRASKELLEHVQDRLQTVKTVEADFVQEKTLVMFDHTVTISGHFALQKPDRLVWIVNKPVRYVVRIEGTEIRQWDQDTGHVQVIQLGKDPAFKAVSDQIQAWFMGDYTVLLKTFDVDVQSEKPLVLGFTPKAESLAGKMLKHIDMTFGEDETHIDSIVVLEAGGDETKLKFIHPKLNEEIKPEIWEIPPRE